MGIAFLLTLSGLLFSLWNVMALLYDIPKYANIIVGILPLPFTILSILINAWDFYIEGHSRKLILKEMFYKLIFGDYYPKHQIKRWISSKSIYCNPMCARKVFDMGSYTLIENERNTQANITIDGVSFNLSSRIDFSDIDFTILRRNGCEYQGIFCNRSGDFDVEGGDWNFGGEDVLTGGASGSYYPVSFSKSIAHNDFNIAIKYKIVNPEVGRDSMMGHMSIIITHPNGYSQVIPLGCKNLNYLISSFYVLQNYPETGVIKDIDSLHVRRGYVVLHSMGFLDCIDIVMDGGFLCSRFFHVNNMPVIFEGEGSVPKKESGCNGLPNVFDFKSKMVGKLTLESRFLMLYKNFVLTHGKDFCIVFIEYLRMNPKLSMLNDFKDLLSNSAYPLRRYSNWGSKRVKKDISSIMYEFSGKTLKYLDKVNVTERTSKLIYVFKNDKEHFYKKYETFINNKDAAVFTPRVDIHKPSLKHYEIEKPVRRAKANRGSVITNDIPKIKAKVFEGMEDGQAIKMFFQKGKIDIPSYKQALETNIDNLKNAMKAKDKSLDRKKISSELSSFTKAKKAIYEYTRTEEYYEPSCYFYGHKIMEGFLIDGNTNDKQKEEIDKKLLEKRRKESEIMNLKAERSFGRNKKEIEGEWIKAGASFGRERSKILFSTLKTKPFLENKYDILSSITEDDIVCASIDYIGAMYGNFEPSCSSKDYKHSWSKRKTASSKFLWRVRDDFKRRVSLSNISVPLGVETLRLIPDRIRKTERYNKLKKKLKEKMRMYKSKGSMVYTKHGVEVTSMKIGLEWTENSKKASKGQIKNIRNVKQQAEIMSKLLRYDLHKRSIEEISPVLSHAYCPLKRRRSNRVPQSN